MTEHKAAFYARELRRTLPARLFERDRTRLVWLLGHTAFIAGAIYLIASAVGGWWLTLLLSIAIGNSFGALAFVAHEILHGAVVRGRRTQLILGWVAFLPFTISPRLWIAWHNRAHHGRTMAPCGADPDAGGTLLGYETSRSMRIFDHVTVGRWRPGGALLFLIGFNGQSIRVLVTMARQLGYVSRRELAFVLVETFLGAAVWTAVAAAIGFVPFVFAFLIPLMIGNFVVMSYILTNHNLSPMTEVNDPLLNSLSVTTSPLIDFVHLNFGLHVEHHLFPSMSSSHARDVRDEIKRRWPERYQSMPLHRALTRLWLTARIYADNETLCDPTNGQRWTTLLPVTPGSQQEVRWQEKELPAPSAKKNDNAPRSVL